MCLNLQETHLNSAHPLFVPSADRVLTRAQRCLKWARGFGLRIVHVHTIRAGDRALCPSPPIPGFEPRASEAVIQKHAHSFFSSAEFARLEGAARDIIALGFTTTQDCLAAAIDADRVGARLAFVSDAIASTAMAPFGAEIVDAIALGVLAQFAGQVSSEELIARTGGEPTWKMARSLVVDTSQAGRA